MQHKTYKKIALVILDGFGVASSSRGNAVSLAQTPIMDEIVDVYPSLTLQASGPLVGLPWGEMGNSEVGHLNIGAGRIVGQDLPRITNSIQTGEFFQIPAFVAAMQHVLKNGSKLHLMGLVSPGGVHSFDEHLYALLGMAAEHRVDNVFIHMFTDGRDTDEKIALETLRKLRTKMSETGVGQIATIAGRFYAMDRGGHWNQTIQTYDALTKGLGQYANSAEECIMQNYSNQVFDEMIPPSVILKDQNTREPVTTIGDNDAVIFINFRSDRAIQLTQAFTLPQALPEQFRQPVKQNLLFVTMTEYAPDLPVQVAFPSVDLRNNLAEMVSRSGLTQFHIAESEKYAHVTVFFNCGKSDKYPGEERVIVTSPTNNARNYVDTPQMSAEELTDILAKRIRESDTNFFVANFANCDMVGHTGSLKASVKAVEYIDKCIGLIKDAILAVDGVLIITADHGNAEQMINRKTGEIDKDHTTNPVPFLVIAEEFKFERPADKNLMSLSAKVPAGVVSDIAPTVLELFGLPKPQEMTGINLLESL